MKRVWPLVALGVLAYLAFAIVTLPASVVIPRVQPEGVMIAGLDGSVWNGSAEVLQVGGAHIGSIAWNLHVLPLFTLRAAADIDLKRTDGFARGGVSVGKQRIQLSDFSASVPINLLPPQLARGGWNGSINARLAELTLIDGWPRSADGTIEIADLTGPARNPTNLGSFQLKFPVEANEANTLAGSVNDIAGGPIQFAGKVLLKSTDRSYLIEGLIATKADAPAAFSRSLEILGPPDAQGRREFSISGTM